MVAIEAIYIFDEHNNPILEHVYAGRPPSATSILPQYLSQPSPRPSVIYLPSLNPPTLVFAHIQDRLLFLSPASSDIEPLLVIEFLHRVADALQEFLGAPLLASKIDGSYDVVAQVVGEMCDAGLVCNTEPNALAEVVEVPSLIGNFLGGFGLPSSAPVPSMQRPGSPFAAEGGSSTSSSVFSTASAIPWRKSNVRHTSNELYVDIIEKMSVILAPSGRPLSAFVNGTIVFTAHISGIPELLLTISAPGGKSGIQNAMDLPCFHPCVRLSRWRDHPGELSFVPPDGRFVLASYECNLLPELFTSSAEKIPSPNLSLPASIEIYPSLGPDGDELEVRLSISRKVTVANGTSDQASGTNRNPASGSRFGAATSAFGSSSNNAPTMTPVIQDVVVTIPVSSTVRNVDNLRPNKGEAHFMASENLIEWRISTKEITSISGAGAILRATLIGPLQDSDTDAAPLTNPLTSTYDYDENETNQISNQPTNGVKQGSKAQTNDDQDATKVEQNAMLMPRSANISFRVRGWLASGIKVESLNVNTKTSKGLGSGVTPYKGVKYHTISEQGVEARC